MPGLYSHTTRSDGTTLTASIYNTDHQTHIDNHEPQQMDDYSSTVAQMRTATDPGEVGSESQPTSMAGELERLRYVWKTTFAWSQWYALKEGVLPRSFLAGLGLANNAVDADHDIDIAVGEARGSGDDADLNLTSAITKQIDAAWAVGTNAGGLDTGVVAADTWYHVHLIKRMDTGVVDALFSLSATAPTMPTNYAKRRRIGAVLTNSVANIIAFAQSGDLFVWKDPPFDIDDSTLTTAMKTYTISVPGSLNVIALINAIVKHSTAAIRRVYLPHPGAIDEAPNETAGPGFTIGTSDVAEPVAQLIRLRTSTSSDIRARSSGASTIFRVATVGWVDRRGRDD